MFEIIFTRKFKKDVKKNHSLRKQISKQVDLFINNKEHPSLHSEKLQPKHYERYSFRINKQYRVIYTFEDNIPVLLYISKHYE